MKLLLISSDDDYGFLSYEQSSFTKEKVVKACEEEGGKVYFEEDDYYFWAKLYTFKDVDPKFIDFIRNEFMDYDSAKHTDFIVVEE